MNEEIITPAKKRTELITILLLWADTVLDLLRFYGFAVLAAALMRGIIGGFAGLFAAMTISGAVLMRYVVQRMLAEREISDNILYRLPGVITVLLLMILLHPAAGIVITIYSLVAYGMRLWKKKAMISSVSGAVGIVGSQFVVIRAAMASAGAADCLMIAFASFIVFKVLLRESSDLHLVPEFFSHLLSGIALLPLMMMTWQTSQCMKTALDETMLYRASMDEALLVCGGLLFVMAIVLRCDHKEPKAMRISYASLLVSALLTAAMVCTLDMFTGITLLLVMAAYSGALVVLAMLKREDRKMHALRTMILGLGELAVIFVCLARYNGISFAVRDALCVWMVMVVLEEYLDLYDLKGLVNADE